MSITALADVQNVRLDDTAAGPDVARMTVIGKTSDANQPPGFRGGILP